MASELTDPGSQWKLNFGLQFPKISDIALRLLMMRTQSAGVECACKAHKLVHSKVRNRPTGKNVKLLLFCHINQLLLKKMELQVQDKNFDPFDEMEDFLGQALVIHMEDEVAQPQQDPSEEPNQFKPMAHSVSVMSLA